MLVPQRFASPTVPGLWFLSEIPYEPACDEAHRPGRCRSCCPAGQRHRPDARDPCHVLPGRQRVRGHERAGAQVRGPERRRQGRGGHGALPYHRRAVAGATGRRPGPRHRPRDRPGWLVQALPRCLGSREGPPLLGGELRRHRAVARADARRQGHPRLHVAAHDDRALRQQDPVRAGQGGPAGAEGDLGRVGGRRAPGGARNADQGRDGLGPLGPPFRRPGHQLRGCDLRCQGRPHARRRLPHHGQQVRRLAPGRHDAARGLGRRGRLDLCRFHR